MHDRVHIDVKTRPAKGVFLLLETTKPLVSRGFAGVQYRRFTLKRIAIIDTMRPLRSQCTQCYKGFEGDFGVKHKGQNGLKGQNTACHFCLLYYLPYFRPRLLLRK